MRLPTIPLVIGAALMLSAPAFAQDSKADAPAAKPKQSAASPAASETIINLKVTGMT